MKFKVGDKVRVRKDLKEGQRYYMEDKNVCNAFVRPMNRLKGRVVTISKILGSQYVVEECPLGVFCEYFWTDEMFEPVVEPRSKKIVITTDGTETHARLYEENKLVKTATAKCSPEDTFDFATGARIAFIRLFEGRETEAVKPRIEVGKYYNGKVVCTHKDVDAYGYTVGKIYEFVNGTVVDDDGDTRFLCMPVSDISTVRFVRFIPLVE